MNSAIIRAYQLEEDYRCILEFLRRTQRLGATVATVSSYSTGAPASYQSMGFTEFGRLEPWINAEQKLLHILRGGTNTVYELRRGEKFVWVLRFTAVVVREADGWKFVQMNFSFPTIDFPDVRFMDEQSE